MANHWHNKQLRERRAAKLAREEEIAKELLKKKAKKEKIGKNVTTQLLSSKIYWNRDWFVRNPNDFKPVSYNIEKNVDAFIKHCYVKYTIPKHLLEECKHQNVTRINASRNRLWFLTVAHGFSFYKETKEFFNKKEAHIFLNYKGDYTIEQVIWYTKLKFLGVSDSFNKRCIDRIFFDKIFFNTESRISLLNFLAHYEKDLNNNDFNELCDYFRHTLNNNVFSYKGRKPSSVIKLSNEWHELTRKAKIDELVKWEPMFNSTFETFDNTHRIKVIELVSNHDLVNEGRKQKHCVGGYTSRCRDGYTAIFSMRFFHKKIEHDVEDVDYRITLEVDKKQRKIVQAKHKMNACVSTGDKNFIRAFAGEKGLSISSYL